MHTIILVIKELNKRPIIQYIIISPYIYMLRNNISVLLYNLDIRFVVKPLNLAYASDRSERKSN